MIADGNRLSKIPLLQHLFEFEGVGLGPFEHDERRERNDAFGMLSPKAMNFVFAIDWEDRTVTGKVHAACFMSASVAVHRTVVSPMGKTLPEPGSHLTVYGARPPVGVGASKCTSVPCAVVASRTIAVGQDISRGGP